MNIVLHPEHLPKFVKAGYKDAETHSHYNAHRPMRLKLTDMNADDINVVEKVFKTIGDLKSKIALSNIRVFKDADNGSDVVKVKSLQDFVPVLRGYIKNSPLGKKGQFILLEQGDDDDLWMPHACTGIAYHPPVRTRWGTQPPYVKVSIAYYKDGKVHGSSISFFKKEVVGKTCGIILRTAGWTICDNDLLAKYEDDTKRFREIAPLIGLKCLARGTATSTTEDDNRWWRSDTKEVSMETDGKRTAVVIDILEGKKDDKSASPRVSAQFWYAKGEAVEIDDGYDADDDTNEIEEGEAIIPSMDAPLHPYLHVFDLARHDHVDIHVRYLEAYKYDANIGKSLVLPVDSKELIEALVGTAKCSFEDIIAGKSGGTIIMCSGEPGTGKTLTAEAYAEVMGRPLYSIQSSQLGTTANELEAELKTVLQRAMRWKAILLIDEADVFIHERGESIEHNAVVGIFLRVLEYYSGVLFMTTNRATIVDDAIASRCTAHVTYAKPDDKGRIAIWRILSEKAKIQLAPGTIERANVVFPSMSGRDIKNLLKLSNYIATHRKKPIDLAILQFAKRFSMGGIDTKGSK